MLEFSTWFIWLGLFAVLKQRICRAYPGIRSAFRGAFIATAAVAVAPPLWMLLRAHSGAPHLIGRLNHYFGIGIYAQTTLQALLQVRWLAVAPFGLPFVMSDRRLANDRERQLVAAMTAINRVIRKP